MLTTVEAIGDITATEEASALATFGDKHNRRVQGGLLGDGQFPSVSSHVLGRLSCVLTIHILGPGPLTGSICKVQLVTHLKHQALCYIPAFQN